MALVLADRVQQTGTANTTVSFTLSGSVTGFQSFAVIGNTNTTYYSAFDVSGNWEVGLGTYSTTGPTLTRTTIYQSSNSNAAVTFSGAVNIFVTYPSGRSVNLNESGNVNALGTVSSGTWQGSTIDVAYGGTGQTTATAAFNALSPMTTTGDIIYEASPTTAARLGIGTTGQVLTVAGGIPSWATPATGGGTITRTDFTATAGQTVFSVTYPVGLIDVYRNGVKLAVVDFTATNGTSFTLATAANLGDVVQAIVFSALNLYQTITTDTFSGTGSQTVFTMSVAPANSASTLVAISGVVQNPSNYTVSSTTLTFLTAPPSGTNNISVRYLGVPGTTSVSSISFGSTGLTPNSSTTGAVTVAGTLVAANGGTGLTSPGTAGNLLTSNGTAWTSAPPPAGSVGDRGQVFTSSGTFTVPTGVTSVKVTVVGGGGGGGFGATSSGGGGGGGGGGVAVEFVTGLTPGGTVAVTVGAGGAINGGTGGTSSFGAFCSATGGGGGSANSVGNAAGGGGGSGSGGDYNLTGGRGGALSGGAFVSGAGGASGGGGAQDSFKIFGPCGSTQDIAGISGGGQFGQGAYSAVGAATGNNATGFGNGGSGGVGTGLGARNGGTGSAGIVIVEF